MELDGRSHREANGSAHWTAVESAQAFLGLCQGMCLEHRHPARCLPREQIQGIWRVLLAAKGFAIAGLAVSRAFGDKDLKDPKPLVTAAPEVKTHQVRLRARGPAVAREGRGLCVSRWPVGGVWAIFTPLLRTL